MSDRDPSIRLLIGILAEKDCFTEEERTEAVKDLLADGLTIGDIQELIPRLLGPSRAKRAETAADRSPVLQTTLRL